MNYKQVVDRIEEAVQRHLMLADFGYGQLSDIKVLDDDSDGADYPYAFLNPGGISRTAQMQQYTFNLIIMEMALNPREILKVQSDAIQYLNDIISELRFDVDFTGDVQLTSSIQVFRERFQDEVAGATAQLTIQVADAIDNCDAPIAADLDVYVLQALPQTIGPDPGVDSAFTFQTTELDVYDEWNLNRWTTERGGQFRLELSYSFFFDASTPSDPFPNEPVARVQTVGGGVELISATTSSWPTNPQLGETYTVKQVFNVTLLRTPEYLTFMRIEDAPGDEKNLLVMSGANLKIYEV